MVGREVVGYNTSILFFHAEDDDTAVGVGERRIRLPKAFRQTAFSGLIFQGHSFWLTDEIYHVLFCHNRRIIIVAPHCLAALRETSRKVNKNFWHLQIDSAEIFRMAGKM